MNNENFTDEEDLTNVGTDRLEDYLIRRKEYKKLQEEEQIFRFEQFERRNAERRKNVLFVLMVFVILALYCFAVALAKQALSILKEIKIITLEFPKEVGQVAFTSPIDWHVMFIVTSILIPPTILSYMLIKGVYGITKGSNTPIGEILTQVKETLENLKGITEASSPKSKD